MTVQQEGTNKILIVDDQYGIRALLKEILQTAGYKTCEAANGVQALSIVEKEDPGLVLLDMKIPGMNGLQILKRVKEKSKDTKVVIMTAYGELEMIEEAKAHGAITHFPKPFDIDEVLDFVKKELPSPKK
ncbi:MAG TPA: response regulator [Bacillales bacterium]|nr:response regulator [Bacillales bacterium]